MGSFGYSDENDNYGEDFEQSYKGDFEMPGCSECEVDGCYDFMNGNEGYGDHGYNTSADYGMGSNAVAGTRNNSCGVDKVSNRNYNVSGKQYEIVNRNFYNNYYNRYNHYYVTEYDIIKNYVKDFNVYHYCRKTVNGGCQYLGSTTVVAQNGGGASNRRCCYRKNSCGCC